MFGGGVTYVYIASLKKFGQETSYVAGVSFIWLPLITWVTYYVGRIIQGST